ncbi:hypothetical protein RFI_07810 [Reticulomyxa filosa]|uniref:Wbp11/ELF5/Saf1 N-terminal domain-containing protein n=1 Tax=Reticulomyxa filosa TaxID=46433 RepID=X6NU50_RETFI|nr:hypothetical protein RFI_07810 [Reticulomyxa filosa]|eukprot:ETO29314.1 hypothetical protein RFI_07810 [Reticulomyxa filosa]
MGRNNKSLNPVDAWRKKQKTNNEQKLKQRQESQHEALRRRNPEWLMNEIRKINEMERLGQTNDRHVQKRKKLIEAYNEVVKTHKKRELRERIKSQSDKDKQKGNDEDDEEIDTSGFVVPASEHQVAKGVLSFFFFFFFFPPPVPPPFFFFKQKQKKERERRVENDATGKEKSAPTRNEAQVDETDEGTNTDEEGDSLQPIDEGIIAKSKQINKKVLNT